MAEQVTVWEVRDRQGVKRFLNRPKYIALHDIFTGRPASRARKAKRVIRRFKADVIGGGTIIGNLGYPKRVQITDWRQ